MNCTDNENSRDDFADHIVDEKVSISNYRLSASVACGKVCNFKMHPPTTHNCSRQFCCALEDLWDVV